MGKGVGIIQYMMYGEFVSGSTHFMWVQFYIILQILSDSYRFRYNSQRDNEYVNAHRFSEATGIYNLFTGYMGLIHHITRITLHICLWENIICWGWCL